MCIYSTSATAVENVILALDQPNVLISPGYPENIPIGFSFSWHVQGVENWGIGISVLEGLQHFSTSWVTLSARPGSKTTDLVLHGDRAFYFFWDGSEVWFALKTGNVYSMDPYRLELSVERRPSKYSALTDDVLYAVPYT